MERSWKLKHQYFMNTLRLASHLHNNRVTLHTPITDRITVGSVCVCIVVVVKGEEEWRYFFLVGNIIFYDNLSFMIS